MNSVNIILYVWMEIIDMVIFYEILSRLREIMIVGIRRMKRIGGVGECVIVYNIWLIIIYKYIDNICVYILWTYK